MGAIDQQLQELREAVLAMAFALGAALPMTPDVARTLSEIADTDTEETA